MVSFSVSSEYIALTFVNKVVVFRRRPENGLGDERVLPIEEPKSDESSPITDGATPSVCSAFSQTGKFLAAACGKNMALWETTNWTLLGSKNLIRAASCVVFTNSEDRILLSDKSGDAYVYRKDEFDRSHQATPESALLLGHVSMLLRIGCSQDDRFVITCDRDEKIRVSHLPNAYNIQNFCLGHTDAVTCFNIPSCKPEVLVSGSSDGTIRLWEFQAGKHLLTYNCAAGEEEAVVDLVTLPVDEDSFLVCAVLKRRRFIRVMLANPSKNTCSHIEDVSSACTVPLSLAACGNELFVLSVDSPNYVTAFKNHGPSLTSCSELNGRIKDCLRKFCDDFTSVAENISEDRLFTYLNKRKIDDTQEYYKRKHDRLQAANAK